MTSLLRRKRPITAPAGSPPARTPVSVVALGVVLVVGGWAAAQQPLPALPPLAPAAPWQPTAPDLSSRRPAPPVPPGPVRTLTFHKPAGQEGTAPVLKQVQGMQGRSTLSAGVAPDVTAYAGQLEPPAFQRLIRLESEEALRARMHQEARDLGSLERLTFPDDRQAADERIQARRFPRQVLVAEPNYVCHKQLFFHEKNAERYGWDLGAVQPFLSTAYFYKDWVTFPYHWASRFCDCYDSGAGECLPGDPVPYLLYPPGLSAKGGLAEAGAIIGLVAIFP